MPSVEIPPSASWEATAHAHCAARDAKLASYGYELPAVSAKTLTVVGAQNSVLNEEERAIINSTPEDLVAALAKGEVTAEAVTLAFCKTATIAQSLTNAITATYFDKAASRAKWLDKELKRTGKVVGPLHGLPISLKNQVEVEGEEMNLCYVGWVGRVAKKNAVLVDCLLKQGAVVYCATNMPQALFSGETVCNLHGRTVNPWNRNLSSGGSSGGEGALIAMRGSVLGVGSDLGGSIRIPAAFNGLYGFRPSYNRVPYGGASNSQEGQEAVPSVLGPLSVSVGGLALFFRAVIAAEPWRQDPLALHMPFNEELYQLKEHNGGKKLCFGFISDNGVAKPDPPYARALAMAKKALEAQGHSVIDYTPPDAQEGAKLLVSIYAADGGADVQHECDISGEPNLGGILKGSTPPHLSTYEFWQLSFKRRKYIANQLAAWEATSSLTGTGRPVDALISPPAPYVSFKHGEKQDIYYTGIGNLNDWPSTVFPVTRVDPAVDVPTPAYDYHTDFDKLNHERYDPAVFAGMPVALQVAGRKGEDEAVLKITEIVVEALAALKQ